MILTLLLFMFGKCGETFSGSGPIRQYDNKTMVADYACDPNPDGIPPYTRPNNAPDPCSGFVPDCTCDNPKCGEWPVDEQGELDVDGPTAQNLFTEVDLFENLSRCFQRGFKNAQAKKSWHGRFGYTYEDQVRAYPGGTPPGTCTSCSVECEHTGVPSTKYLQVDATASHTFWPGSPSGLTERSAVVVRSFAVNSNSGIKSLSGSCSDTVMGVSPGPSYDTLLAAARDLVGYADWDLVSTVGEYFNTLGVLAGTLSGVTYAETVSACGLKHDATWTQTAYDSGGDHFDAFVVLEGHLDVGAGTMSITKHQPRDDDPHTIMVYFHEEISWTETTFHYEDHQYEIDATDAPIGTEFQRNVVDGGLSVTYTFATVWSELVALAAMIDLTNDSLYSWRTDAFTTIAPTVSRNEKGPVAPAASSGDCLYADPDTARYDGTIRGIMDIRAMKDGWFDYDHVVFDSCVEEEVGCIWFVRGYGEWSGSSVVPKTSTQWTNKYNACNLFPGAWVGMSGTEGAFAQPAGSNVPAGPFAFGAGVVALQKWAEIKQPFHRFNSSRPCGADKSILDESTVRCVTGVSGSTLTLGEAATSYTTVGVSGVAGFADGIYSMASGSGTSWVLGSLIEARSFSDGPSVIGEIKYPSAGACTGDFYLPSAGKVLHAEWQHDFRDYQERHRYNLQVADCACSGLSAAAEIRDGQVAFGMPQSVKSFTPWPHVVGSNPCGPTVIAITPNGETWPGGITVDFSTCPLPAAADSRYGSLWQAEVIQILSDPYWQNPRQCNELDRTESIVVACPPVIEAELLPSPPLGWLFVDDIGTMDGNVLPPPSRVGYDFGCTPNPAVTPGLPWTRSLAGCDDNGKNAWTAP